MNATFQMIIIQGHWEVGILSEVGVGGFGDLDLATISEFDLELLLY